MHAYVDAQLISLAHMMVTIEGGSGDNKKYICGTYVHPIFFYSLHYGQAQYLQVVWPLSQTHAWV